MAKLVKNISGEQKLKFCFQRGALLQFNGDPYSALSGAHQTLVDETFLLLCAAEGLEEEDESNVDSAVVPTADTPVVPDPVVTEPTVAQAASDKSEDAAFEKGSDDIADSEVVE